MATARGPERTRLLVLGAGRHQTPLIRRAEERGIEVVVADYLPDSPGKAYASHPTMVDMLDVDAVGDLVERFSVDGVVTTGTDQSVMTMAEVAHRFGLPEIVTPTTARLATNKPCMKDALRAAGVPMSRYVVVRAADELAAVEHLRMPLVVKPADSQGQRGTQRVENASDVGRAIADARGESRIGEVVVEEFVEGMEVTASAWVHDGRLQLLMITDRVTYNPPPALGIAVQHVHPSRHAADHVDHVRDMVERIRAVYGVERGPMYVQIIVDTEGELSLVEAACRVGGGHEIGLIPLVCGFDVRDRLIDLALTGTCEPSTYEYPGASPVHALVNFLVARPGTFASQHGMDTLIHDGMVTEGAFYHPVGYRQAPIIDGQGRVGYFITSADSRESLATRTRAAFDELSIRGQSGEELAYWPEAQWLRG
jgi:biotin carboxylase